MILDEAVECPRCGKATAWVDELRLDDQVVLQLCASCGLQERSTAGETSEERAQRRPLKLLLREFRRLVQGITATVDARCPECSGEGWRAMRTGRGTSGGTGLRIFKCAACVGTGIDLTALLNVLEIVEKPKPVRRPEAVMGFSPGAPLRGKGRGSPHD